MPSSIHPLPSELFFIAAANAAARAETKLALWPPTPLSLSADAFACSPCHPLSPCSPSNLSLKTSFLPFIIFFLPTSAPASRGLAMAGLESHVISAVAVAWEKKREVCVRSHLFWPSWEVRGQLDADPVSSSRKRTNPLLLCPSLLFAVSYTVFTFFFGFWPLVSLQS